MTTRTESQTTKRSPSTCPALFKISPFSNYLPRDISDWDYLPSCTSSSSILQLGKKRRGTYKTYGQMRNGETGLFLYSHRCLGWGFNHSTFLADSLPPAYHETMTGPGSSP